MSFKSPFDIPELASLIASYITKKSDLARCARVSHSLHDICIPILWKSMYSYNLDARKDPDGNAAGSRMDLVRYGKHSLIEELTVSHKVSDADMEMVVENCTGLKALNFEESHVTAENIAVLIPGDPSQAQDIDSGDRSTRCKTRFPYHLESLSFKQCWKLTGSSWLETVSLLGPQLKRLSLDNLKGITDQDMIKVVRRCPNLVELQLRGIEITDEFLSSFAQEFHPSGSTSTPGRHRQQLENLNLKMVEGVSSKGLLPVVKACRSTLKSLSARFLNDVNDKVLFALVADPTDENAAEGLKVEPSFTPQANALDHSNDKTPIMQHRFSPNTVLTEICLSDPSPPTDEGFKVLFRFATEMVSMKLDIFGGIADGALMVLAETYRNRMKTLGLGVPAAWKEHVLADERVHAMARDEASANGSKRPWACSRLRDLNMSGMDLEATPQDLEVIDDDPHGFEAASRAHYREELAESLRFPLAMDSYPQEDDFDESENYDYMTKPQDEYDYDGNQVRSNTPRQRAILQEFYSKLGQLSQLRTLNMSYGQYRVRVKDGLEFVLPGLQQNLTSWKVDMENRYQMGKAEVEFFGKHFGYGEDFSVEKNDGQDQLEGKTRKARLEHLVLDAEAVRHVRCEVKDWATRQGFDLELAYRSSASESMSSKSPFDIPELAYLIVSHISENSDLARCARVSHSLHDICIPILWRTICLSSAAAMKIWHRDKGFRMGLIRYSKLCPIEQLLLTHTFVQDGDMELIAENCTRLKTLDLTATNVTAETLRVLIHSDPNRTRDSGASEGAKKRKIRVGTSTKRTRGSGGQQHADDDDEVEFEDEGESGKDGLDQASSVEMNRYPELTETETEREPDSQYESVGIEHSTATESEQDSNLPTGPISVKSRASALLERPIPLHRSAGTARPVKFKGIKTRFPFFLESLTLKRCPNLAGPSCLEVVSLLGPQLKRLVLNHVSDITDQDMIKFVKHCPNLVELQLRGTEITDEFLSSFAREFLPSNTSFSNPSRPRKCLENLNLDMTSASSTGLLPMIKACRPGLNTLSMHHLHGVADDVLFALFEDPTNKDATEVSIAGPYLTAQALALGIANDHVPITTHRFSPNTVLTDIHLAFCSLITDAGFEILFRFATELVSVDLSGCELKDDTLMVLAETYRNRMKALGLGIPAAWREHVLAVKGRARAMDPSITVEENHQDIDTHTTTTNTATSGSSTSSSDLDSKVFTTGRVPGGLRKLLLPHCKHLSNRGARAILRSCVGLEVLDIGNCIGLTLEIFHGPWASLGITDLHMEGMALQVSPPVDLGFVEVEEVMERKEQLLEENLEWFRRFPSPRWMSPYPPEEDFDEDGHYDHVVIPIVVRPAASDVSSDEIEDDDDGDRDEGHDSDVQGDEEDANRAPDSIVGSDDDDDDDDDDTWGGYDRQREDRRKEAQRRPVPSELRRNTPRQRGILRAFYSKLGQLSQLQILNMTNCNFRLRVKDGLELVLPALQQNLVEWRLNLIPSYRLQNSELEFFGKHFGYGLDFKADEHQEEEDELFGKHFGYDKNQEEEEEEEEEHQVQEQRKELQTRTGKLRVLLLEATSVDHVNPKVVHWAGQQGFHLNFEDGLDW
ncbi:hypothetical protein BGZ67_006072 [Mortierella alpina]|nr:hypothetical protein BGZ67_006072 [Mortierella alpina]